VNDFWPLQSNYYVTTEEFNTLIAQHEAAATERETLCGKLKVSRSVALKTLD
jgi:hypothetical protein